MLYNIVLVSAIQQCESGIEMHMSPLSWTSLTPSTHSHHSRLLQSPYFCHFKFYIFKIFFCKKIVTKCLGILVMRIFSQLIYPGSPITVHVMKENFLRFKMSESLHRFREVGHNNKASVSEVAQSCPTLCSPRDCSLPGSSIYGIFQARVLEWVSISINTLYYCHIIHFWISSSCSSSSSKFSHSK